MKKIIFLSGIHGVGKGYIKEEIKKEINITYIWSEWFNSFKWSNNRWEKES